MSGRSLMILRVPAYPTFLNLDAFITSSPCFLLCVSMSPLFLSCRCTESPCSGMVIVGHTYQTVELVDQVESEYWYSLDDRVVRNKTTVQFGVAERLKLYPADLSECGFRTCKRPHAEAMSTRSSFMLLFEVRCRNGRVPKKKRLPSQMTRLCEWNAAFDAATSAWLLGVGPG